MSTPPPDGAPGAPVEPSTLRVALAFAAVYLVWGSTYLAIRFAIETIPPFTMASLRFLVAGGLLYAWARARGARRPTPGEWRDAALVGGLLLLGGNGAVVWAEQWVPSGLTALLVATVPLWMVLLDWLWAGSARPGVWAWFGLVWGLLGVWLLVGGPEEGGSLTGPAFVGGVVILLGSLSWAFGSILSRSLRLPPAPRMATALQMLAGGLLLGVAGGAAGEWQRWEVGGTSAKSLLALAYLILFGALVGYAAYIWLLRVSTPARVATYAYVNPVVALFLGWALAAEPLTPRTGVAAAVILSAVVLLNRVSRPRRPVPGRA